MSLGQGIKIKEYADGTHLLRILHKKKAEISIKEKICNSLNY